MLRGRPFVKGQSGNPRGRPPSGQSLAECVRRLGGEEGGAYVAQLLRLATAPDTRARDRLAAIGVLLDRGYGRPASRSKPRRRRTEIVHGDDQGDEPTGPAGQQHGRVGEAIRRVTLRACTCQNRHCWHQGETDVEYSREEQETVTRFDEIYAEAYLWTASPFIVNASAEQPASDLTRRDLSLGAILLQTFWGARTLGFGRTAALTSSSTKYTVS